MNIPRYNDPEFHDALNKKMFISMDDLYSRMEVLLGIDIEEAEAREDIKVPDKYILKRVLLKTNSDDITLSENDEKHPNAWWYLGCKTHLEHTFEKAMFVKSLNVEFMDNTQEILRIVDITAIEGTTMVFVLSSKL